MATGICSVVKWKKDLDLQERRPVGRPRSGDRYAQLNLRLPVEVIEHLKAIALSEGFITQIGKRKGEPNVSGWLAEKFQDRTN
ncbi:MAG: hypothetical protein IM586_13480 [Pseudanabaena sp. M172S2SP2A07QC]|nr:hypothetical protein [Pseudanabaena sp. M172S2SP2A07QC]MCA6510300.1 hypothetical protein [Pseudanabaena sp. M109S1SP2A07QC]MCA6546650.1 hypothetical protein [Pseudanabaena sp. M152S2SP2A07QC]